MGTNSTWRWQRAHLRHILMIGDAPATWKLGEMRSFPDQPRIQTLVGVTITKGASVLWPGLTPENTRRRSSPSSSGYCRKRRRGMAATDTDKEQLSMKALVYEGPWQLPVRDVSDPQPKPGEVVVEVKAVGVCGSDVHGYTGSTGRRIPPMIMGHEFTGVVTAVGEGVQDQKVGERVVVQPLTTCGVCANCRAGMTNVCTNRTGLGMWDVDGAWAEAVRVPANQLYSLPSEVSWEQGSLVEPLSVSLHAVNITPITLMDTVVILGAGTIGLFALLGCRLKGAGNIIVSDLSPRRLAKAKAMGADLIVNPAEKTCRSGEGVVEQPSAGGYRSGQRQCHGQAIDRAGETGRHVTWIGNSQPTVAPIRRSSPRRSHSEGLRVHRGVRASIGPSGRKRRCWADH
jgi:L-iditol 2-dehydrogenase